jgi:sugar/nucleoside kinase (ribokinase family)
MKVLVLGHLCLDVIHPVDGPEIESYGGIYYSVAALATLLEPRDRVLPVFGVHRAEHPALIELLAKFPNVDTSGIFPFDGPTNRVHLYYRPGGSRTECSRDISAPIPFERIRRSLDVDAILVNMVSGFDVTLETLDAIRIAVRGEKIPLHFDFHSLTLGITEAHERRRRPVEEWRRWAFMIDTLQLNEEEIAGLPLEPMTERQTASHLLTLGVKGVLVTRGPRGIGVYRNDQKHVVRTDIPGIAMDGEGEPTGCGDVFGAAFVVRYARTSDLLASAEFANRIAAAKARLRGVDRLAELREAMVDN